MKTINDFNFAGKRALVRVDFNVPVNSDKQVTDETRIRESLPTIHKILKDGGSVILMSHLGRPKGGFEAKYSLSPVVPVLSRLLNKDIIFSNDLYGPKTVEVCEKLKPGDVLLLENMRFYPEEEKGNVDFAKKISALGDVYVNDAFATAHRAHMTTCTMAQFFPGNKYFGFLLANEIKALNKVLHEAQAPFTAVIGGAKVSTKIPIMKNLLHKVDNMLIGGGMAFTFIKALGGKIGNSLFEENQIDAAREIINEALLKGVNLYIPTDTIAADEFSDKANTQECASDNIPEGWLGLDLGSESCKRFADVINKSQTILWNGPMGVFEMSKFQRGTKAVAISVAGATIAGSFSLVGGGDSVSAINMFNIADQISYVSTGGGAMLEFMEGLELPGIKALME